MADRIFDNSKLWQYESICHEYGLNDSAEKIEHLLRVLNTRDAIATSQASVLNPLYAIMVNLTNLVSKAMRNCSPISTSLSVA